MRRYRRRQQGRPGEYRPPDTHKRLPAMRTGRRRPRLAPKRVAHV